MVRLRPMEPADFGRYLERAVRGYAEEKVRAGNWSAEEALERSAREFGRLLPEGVNTPGQHLYTIEDEASGEKVGMIWLAVSPYGVQEEGFLYDFLIEEPFRRRGFGAAALYAVEDKARALGLKRLGLHVFGHNMAARALYEKVGYEITNINMSKAL